MAWTEKYVAADAPGGLDGTSPTEDGGGVGPWTLEEADGSAVAGERVNVESGAYSVGSIVFADGTNFFDACIWVRGYNAVIGDLDEPTFNADGTLVTTNYPVITHTTTTNFTPGAYSKISCLKVSSASTTFALGSAANDSFTLFACSIENTANSAAARCVQADNYCTLTYCDFVNSGASSGYCVEMDVDATVIGCLVFNKSTTGAGCIKSSGGYVVGCVCAGDGVGIYIDTTSASTYQIAQCSFEGLDTAIQSANAGQTTTNFGVYNCVAYNCTKWIDNLRVATANHGFTEIRNALGSIGTARTGVGNGILVGEVTLTGDPFTNAAAYNYMLDNTASEGAACRAAGYRPHIDIGALQHEDAGGGGGGGGGSWGAFG